MKHPISSFLFIFSACALTACGGSDSIEASAGAGAAASSAPVAPAPTVSAALPAMTSSARLHVQGPTQVREGDTAVFEVSLAGIDVSAPRQVTLEVQESANAQRPHPMHVDANGFSAGFNPFKKGEYIGNGTVFTRHVGAMHMPIAANSSKIFEHARGQLPHFQAKALAKGFPLTVTSLNTEKFHIPIYVVDSRNSSQQKAYFFSEDDRVKNSEDLVEKTTGEIPFPFYGAPSGIFPYDIKYNDERYTNPEIRGDLSLAIYDFGTGLFREYFMVQKQEKGGWHFHASGYYQGRPGLRDGLAADNYWMQLTRGSSAVVGMLNPLSQVGISEVLEGEINHALSVTLPDARQDRCSFPARQCDGTDLSDNAAWEGQWFRIRPDANLDALGLKPLTLIIAKAIQKYGGYGADKNHWNFAFNAEPGVNWYAAGQPDPWRPGGKIYEKFNGYKGGLDINDFPWHLVEWAEPNWNAVGPNAGVYGSGLRATAVIDGKRRELTVGPDDRVTLPAGVNSFQVRLPTSALAPAQSAEMLGLKVTLSDGYGRPVGGHGRVQVNSIAVGGLRPSRPGMPGNAASTSGR